VHLCCHTFRRRSTASFHCDHMDCRNASTTTSWRQSTTTACVGSATALVTFICVRVFFCTLRTLISRSICDFTHLHQ
jgi:hypothetical protein